MKKRTKKRSIKLWKLIKLWAKLGAKIQHIPITDSKRKMPLSKHPATNPLYMKKILKKQKIEREIIKLLFDCPDFETLGYELNYDDKKYRRKKKNE